MKQREHLGDDPGGCGPSIYGRQLGAVAGMRGGWIGLFPAQMIRSAYQILIFRRQSAKELGCPVRPREAV
jgi:hypothetical protein